MAGPIWINTMKQALAGVPNTPFTVAPGIVQKAVCFGNGGLANSSGVNTYNEYFLASALPTATCTSAQKEPEKPAEKPQEEEKPKETTPTDEIPTEDTNTGSGNGSGNGNGNGNGSGNETIPGGGTGGIQLPVNP
jgi:membrane carboxypeptidase/penicillin-binding protein